MKKKPRRKKGDIEGVADYLEANGWTVVVIGPGRVEQTLGSRKFQYQFVVNFTGSKRPDGTSGQHTKETKMNREPIINRVREKCAEIAESYSVTAAMGAKAHTNHEVCILLDEIDALREERTKYHNAWYSQAKRACAAESRVKELEGKDERVGESPSAG